MRSGSHACPYILNPAVELALLSVSVRWCMPAAVTVCHSLLWAALQGPATRPFPSRRAGIIATTGLAYATLGEGAEAPGCTN